MTDHRGQDHLITAWVDEQRRLRERLVMEDTEPWEIARSLHCLDSPPASPNGSLRYVAGLDISFEKEGGERACAGLVVLDVADGLKVVYKDVSIITMTLPYVSGFLAYREAPFLLAKLERLKRERPELYPQCILVDGNGTLHAGKCGAACHIGILSDTPTIGVSKKLHQVFGFRKDAEHRKRIAEELRKGGDYFEMFSDDAAPELVAYCYRSTDLSTNPIYVSIGHKISWGTCLWVLKQVIAGFRVPEPIRQADQLTREGLKR